jgi:hypothetical protein
MGELYTVVTNKEAKGKRAIVAVVAGSRSETVIDHSKNQLL